MALALYPGSFDPITNGHLNIIERCAKIFDEVVVAVATNINKKPLFDTQERVQLINDLVPAEHVRVTTFEGLLVDYAQTIGANVIVRGLRAVADFEYEFQMTHMNRRLAPEIETVFMMTGEEHFYISSNLVREVAHFGGSVEGLVPEAVRTRLVEKFDGPRK